MKKQSWNKSMCPIDMIALWLALLTAYLCAISVLLLWWYYMKLHKVDSNTIYFYSFTPLCWDLRWVLLLAFVCYRFSLSSLWISLPDLVLIMGTIALDFMCFIQYLLSFSLDMCHVCHYYPACFTLFSWTGVYVSGFYVFICHFFLFSCSCMYCSAAIFDIYDYYMTSLGGLYFVGYIVVAMITL